MVNGGGFIGVRERNAKEIEKWLMEEEDGFLKAGNESANFR
jgi:hypothetical protein